jgi:hypothetical protein
MKRGSVVIKNEGLLAGLILFAPMAISSQYQNFKKLTVIISSVIVYSRLGLTIDCRLRGKDEK